MCKQFYKPLDISFYCKVVYKKIIISRSTEKFTHVTVSLCLMCVRACVPACVRACVCVCVCVCVREITYLTVLLPVSKSDLLRHYYHIDSSTRHY